MNTQEIIAQIQSEWSPKQKEHYRKEQADAWLILLKSLSQDPAQLEEVIKQLTNEQRELLQKLLANSPSN